MYISLFRLLLYNFQILLDVSRRNELFRPSVDRVNYRLHLKLIRIIFRPLRLSTPRYWQSDIEIASP